MKPLTNRCKKYCDLYPCDRLNCNRKPVLYADKPIKMEEPSIWQPIALHNRKRAYKESRVVKTNF